MSTEDVVNTKKVNVMVKYLKEQINAIDNSLSKLEEEKVALMFKRNQLENQLKVIK